MILKKCGFCEKKINVKYDRKFCDRNCREKYYRTIPEKVERRKTYQKKYRNNLENKERLKNWRRDYNQRPEIKEKRRILAVTKYKDKRKNYWKEYFQRPQVKSRIRQRERTKRNIDKRYAIADRLRRSLNHAFKKYSKTGKIMSSKKYGIDWEKVIESLKPFPDKIELFEIDHIRPLKDFNLNKTEEVKKAFDPDNLQWLSIEENRKKGGKILKDTYVKNNMILNKKNGGNIKSLISA